MMNRLIVTFMFCTFFAAQAQADAFKYVTEDGVISFVDDEKRIPAHYKDQAEKIKLLGLEDYPRFTPVVPQPPEEEEKEASSTASLEAPRVASSLPTREYPFTIVREMRWLPNISGSPGDRYVSVDVLRDGTGQELAVVQSDAGFGPLDIYFQP